MRSYKYSLWLSIDYDPWFLKLETDSFFEFLKSIIKNWEHQQTWEIKKI